jgi:tetratricopeptide (TPR) repeat protein
MISPQTPALGQKLDQLGWSGFERLVQALLKAKLGVAVEAWGGSGDMGRDAYFAGKLKFPAEVEQSGPFVFQCKFVQSANAAGSNPGPNVLKAAQAESKQIIERLKNGTWSETPQCYVCITNATLNSKYKTSITDIFRKALPNCTVTLWDCHDISAMILQFPDIWKAFNPVQEAFDAISAQISRLESRLGAAHPLGRRVPPTIGQGFVDRENRLQLFREHFLTSGGQRLAAVQPLTLVAIGGSGKSRAACEFAHASADVYATQLFLRAASPSILRQEIAAISHSIVQGDEQLTEEIKIEIVLTRLPELVPQGLLLIFDGVDDEGTATILKEELFPKLGGAHIIVTTQLRGWGRTMRVVELPSLPPDEAVRYLVQSRLTKGELRDDETRAVSEIAFKLGYLPLALESAGAYVRVEGGSYLDYLALLRENPVQTLGWSDRMELEYPRAVWKAFEIAWDRIKEKNPIAMVILKVSAMYGPAPIPVAFWPERFSTQAVTADAGSGPKEAPPVPTEWNILASIRLLRRYSQIEQYDIDQTHYLLHPVVRTILRSSISEEQMPNLIATPLATLIRVCPGDVCNSHLWPRWEVIRPHVESVIVDAEKVKIVYPTTMLMNTFGRYLTARGSYEKAESLLRRAIVINECAWGKAQSESEWFCLFDQPSVPSLHVQLLTSLAAILAQTDRLSEAERLLTRASHLIRSQAPEDPFIATVTHNMGEILARSGRLIEAESMFMEALQFDEATPMRNELDISRDLHSLGQLLTAAGRFDEAESALCRSIRLDRVWRRCMPMERFLSDKVFIDGPCPLPESWNNSRPYTRSITVHNCRSIKKRLGRLHPALARDLTTLSALRLEQGRKREATRFLEWALGIYLYNWGPFHPTTESTWEKLHKITSLVWCAEDEATYNDWVIGMVLAEQRSCSRTSW